MRNNRFIQILFGVILLGAFALSNTPTRYLHQLFANHLDIVNHSEKSNTPQLNVAGIDCHCESNVVISPYSIQPTAFSIPIFASFCPILISTVSTKALTSSITFGLRGPPLL